MALRLQDGDYRSNGVGALLQVNGSEAVLQRVLFRLTARRGTFPFWETLGSRLWKLGQVPSAGRQAAAKQYVVEALSEEQDLQIEAVTLGTVSQGTAELTVELLWKEEPLMATLDIQM